MIRLRARRISIEELRRSNPSRGAGNSPTRNTLPASREQLGPLFGMGDGRSPTTLVVKQRRRPRCSTHVLDGDWHSIGEFPPHIRHKSSLRPSIIVPN